MGVVDGSEGSRGVHMLWTEATLAMGERRLRWMVMSLPSGVNRLVYSSPERKQMQTQPLNKLPPCGITLALDRGLT